VVGAPARSAPVAVGGLDPGAVDPLEFERGRLDLSTHPFCSGFATGDVRLTTRVNERDLRGCVFGIIHEAGHGLYEQGIDPKLERTPIGHAISLGIHESQSRLWENIVGRSRPFWKHFLPKLRKVFPEQLKGVKLEDFVFAVNEVTPSFIRVEADEVTYNLHIVLRYELEKALIAGTIRVQDLPRLWNARMKELFGITPRRDSEGVLQDIHWAMGLYGYFPTYSLGNLYSAQIWKRARKDIPDVEGRIARGELVVVRDWLRRKIHAPGRTYPAAYLPTASSFSMTCSVLSLMVRITYMSPSGKVRSIQDTGSDLFYRRSFSNSVMGEIIGLGIEL